MAGLAGGEPSLLASQEPERAAVAFMAIPDRAAVNAMRWFASYGIRVQYIRRRRRRAKTLRIGPDSRIPLSTSG